MNLFFTRCQLLVKCWLTALLSGLLLSAQAQPIVTTTSPARNANAAPRPSNVALTYNQPISAATAANVRVFSQQAGGRKALTSASASGTTITLDPALDFKPGETVFVTAPATVQSTGGVAARPYVYQFTAQAGVGPGTFGGGSDPAVGATPYSVVAADVDGDGDLDLLTANYNGGVYNGNNGNFANGTVSVRLNNGTGTFVVGPDASVGGTPQDIVAADLDGDGDLDLLTANYSGNYVSSANSTVSVRFNNGSGSFSGSGEVGVGFGSVKLAVGDVDGDGDLDLLTANRDDLTLGIGNSTVSVRLNNGTGVFAGGVDVIVGDGNSFTRDVAVGDVDGDGDLDILAALDIFAGSTRLNGTVSVRLNNGAGVFTAPAPSPQVSVGETPYSMAVGDVDGDGDLDLLTANFNTSNTVSVRLNNGAGIFTAPATSAEVSVGGTSSNGIYGVTTADVDGDGDLDLLTANNRNSVNGTVSVRLNNGSGTFAGGQEITVGRNPQSVTVGDVDGDGDLDLLTANYDSHTISVRLNQLVVPIITSFTPTSGAAGASVVLTGTDFTGATGVTFNGLAAPGFVVNSATQITVSVPAGATTGLLAVTTPTGTGISLTSFTVTVPPNVPIVASTSPARNANAAPRPSNVALTYNQPISSASASTVRVFSQQAGGRKALTSASASGTTITLNPALDFKPGEKVFVTAPATVFSTGGTAAVPYVYQFIAQAGVGPGTFGGGSDPAVGTNPYSVAVADVDGDGDLDLLAANFNGGIGTGTVSVRLNNGSGTFSAGQQVSVGDIPRGIVAADVDGDGDLDLLTSNYNAGGGNGVSNTVSVRLNNGSGTFSGGSEVTVGDGPAKLTVGDVDGDGDLDLLTANAFVLVNGSIGTSTVSVRLNNGSGTFSAGQQVSVGEGSVDAHPRDVVVADVDGDGDLDLLTAIDITGAGGMVSVRLNNGTGGFIAPTTGTTVNVGAAPRSVVAADVDGDGDLDLLTANTNSSTVSVRLNNGTGVFTAPATGAEVSLGYASLSVVAADVDGDSDLDFLTADYNGNTVSVRLNNGTGTFSAGQQVSVGSNPYNIAVGDADGDGDLDLLTANYGSNTVSVRLNQPAAPTVVSFTPTSGAAGTSVVLTGTNFTGATSVTFNGVAAPGFVVNSATQITVSVPVGATTGAIAVTTTSGTATSSISFTVGTAPTVTISTTSANPTSSAPIPVTVTFSQPVTGFTASGITVTNGSVSSPVTVSGNAYSFNVTPGAAGAVTVSVASGVALNSAGIGNTAALPLVITYQLSTPSSVWTGAVSTDWFGAGNWTAGVPTSSVDALIPVVGNGRYPSIGAGTATARILTLDAGATLTQTGGTLSPASSFVNNGTFLTTGGTVVASSGQLLGGRSLTPFYNLSVGPGGATLNGTATLSQVLILNGNLDTGGHDFTLLSSPTGGDALVVNSGGVVTGTATVQRAIDPRLNTGLGYRHYSAPVSNATVADLATSTFTPVVNPAYNTSATPSLVVPFPNVFGYDQSRVTLTNTYGGFDKGYFSPTALSDPLRVGRGYTVNIGASELVDFQGTLTDGDVPLSLSRNSGAGAEAGGWHLVGNPYPAPLDYSLVAPADRLGLEEAIYVFSSTNAYDGHYRVYVNGLGGNPVLPMAQGFFVRVATGQTSASLTFRNSQRLTVRTATTFQRTAADPRPLVQLLLRNAAGTLADEAYVYFQAGATAGMDAAYDGAKLLNPSGLNLATVAVSNTMAVNGLPLLGTEPLTVPLTVRVPSTGTYTLAAAQLLNLSTVPVYLRDHQTGVLIDLTQQPSYSFTVANAAALSTGRFELVFSPQQPLATVPAALAQQVALYPNPATTSAWVALPAALSRQPGTATLVDAVGRAVRTQVLPAGQAIHTLLLSNLTAGVYALRLTTEAGTLVKKLVVE